MAPRKRARPAPRKAPPPRPASHSRPKKPGGFVGRDPSPVLDRYPPKTGAPPRGPPTGTGRTGPLPPIPPTPTASAAPPGAAPATSPATSAEPPRGLITLEKPFDVDQFAQQLGESSIRAVVPRENLPEVLQRVLEFMGFGIYVYTISVRPSPNELLKSFEVELHRVDFSPATREWQPFQDRGRASNPFGPGRDGATPG